MAKPQLFGRQGFGYLYKNVDKWKSLARHQAVLVLTDLDREACPTALLQNWLGSAQVPTTLLLRIAVREVESWLLADHDSMRGLIGMNGKLPVNPDTVGDPKHYLLNLAKLAPREVRLDLVNESAGVLKQGLGYNARLTTHVQSNWNPAIAAQRSPSLRRARQRLAELSASLAI
jgi:hypothetical protein